MKKETLIKTAIIRIAEKIDYLSREIGEIRGKDMQFLNKNFVEEIEELLKDEE